MATPQAWSEKDLVQPHTVEDKARRVEAMFSAIAPSYDLNNRVHSMWRDQAWRRAAVKMAGVRPDSVVIDVACGTGDLAMAFAKAGAEKIVGVDFTYNMLGVAMRKRQSLPAAIGRRVSYQLGDAMRLPVGDASADVVSIAFGIRNVSRPEAAIAEFFRVLRPGGRVIILEFSLPTNRAMLGLYNFYFRQIMPRTATLISGDRTGAYRYLPQSVSTFIDRKTMVEKMSRAGFVDVTLKPMTMGIAVLYRGVKR